MAIDHSRPSGFEDAVSENNPPTIAAHTAIIIIIFLYDTLSLASKFSLFIHKIFGLVSYINIKTAPVTSPSTSPIAR